MDIFWTETFEKAIGHAMGKPLGRNQGNPQTAGNTAAVYNIMPYTECIGSAPNKAPFSFYLFNNEVEYAQVL